MADQTTSNESTASTGGPSRSAGSKITIYGKLTESSTGQFVVTVADYLYNPKDFDMETVKGVKTWYEMEATMAVTNPQNLNNGEEKSACASQIIFEREELSPYERLIDFNERMSGKGSYNDCVLVLASDKDGSKTSTSVASPSLSSPTHDSQNARTFGPERSFDPKDVRATGIDLALCVWI